VWEGNERCMQLAVEMIHIKVEIGEGLREIIQYESSMPLVTMFTCVCISINSEHSCLYVSGIEADIYMSYRIEYIQL
jgi:hypothetical protein